MRREEDSSSQELGEREVSVSAGAHIPWKGHTRTQ